MPRRKPAVTPIVPELLNEHGTKEEIGHPPLDFPPEYEADILKFYPPPGRPTPAQSALLVNIVSLDHRSLYSLGPKTPERLEVKRLLYNAVVTGFTNGQVSQGDLLYKKAEAAYWDHFQAINRIRYLLGMMVGIVLAAIVGGIFLNFARYFDLSASPQLTILLMLFAGMGSLTSVLTRLSSIDLRQHVRKSIIMISGVARPVVAICFAVIVYIILDMNIIDVQFGQEPGAKRESLYLVTSFLCGFSERFATDIISRVPLAQSEELSEKSG